MAVVLVDVVHVRRLASLAVERELPVQVGMKRAGISVVPAPGLDIVEGVTWGGGVNDYVADLGKARTNAYEGHLIDKHTVQHSSFKGARIDFRSRDLKMV